MAPGLYIPSQDFVGKMRLGEARSFIDYASVEIEDGFEEALERNIATTYNMGKLLPKFIIDAFEGHILAEHYEVSWKKINSVGVKGIDIETMRQINLAVK